MIEFIVEMVVYTVVTMLFVLIMLCIAVAFSDLDAPTEEGKPSILFICPRRGLEGETSVYWVSSLQEADAIMKEGEYSHKEYEMLYIEGRIL